MQEKCAHPSAFLFTIEVRRYTHTRLYARERRIWLESLFICDLSD